MKIKKTGITLSLATFNIEWFGKKGYEKDYPMLFGEIKNCDVIGVQEITDPRLFEQAAGEHLGKSWKFVATDYPIQKVGLLFNSRNVDPLRFETYENVSLGHRQRRPGFLGEFVHRKTGFGFEVMVVHLKSGNRKKDIRTRKAQWKVLSKIIKKLEAAAGNMALLGDMNCFDMDGEHLTELDAFIQSSGLVLATVGDNYTETEKCGGRIDHILVSPAFAQHLTGVFVGGACRLDLKSREEDSNAYCNAYWENVSDHCPVIAAFNI